MMVQRTSIGWYEGRLAGQKTFILLPTRMGVISALCQLVESLNYDDGEGNNYDFVQDKETGEYQ